MEKYARRMDISSQPILRKAEEFCRLLDSRGSGYCKQLGLSADSKLVICLEIAATQSDQSVDKKSVHKLAGLSKKQYSSSLAALQTVLGVQKPLNVRECGVRLGCAQLVERTCALVQRYCDNHLSGDQNLINTNINIMALLVIAGCEKINIPKSKIAELSTLNRAATSTMKEQMQGLVQEIQESSVQESTKLTSFSNNSKKRISELPTTEQKNNCTREASSLSITAEDYTVWKKRILRQARASLKSK